MNVHTSVKNTCMNVIECVCVAMIENDVWTSDINLMRRIWDEDTHVKLGQFA